MWPRFKARTQTRPHAHTHTHTSIHKSRPPLHVHTHSWAPEKTDITNATQKNLHSHRAQMHTYADAYMNASGCAYTPSCICGCVCMCVSSNTKPRTPRWALISISAKTEEEERWRKKEKEGWLQIRYFIKREGASRESEQTRKENERWNVFKGANRIEIHFVKPRSDVYGSKCVLTI